MELICDCKIRNNVFDVSNVIFMEPEQLWMENSEIPWFIRFFYRTINGKKKLRFCIMKALFMMNPSVEFPCVRVEPDNDLFVWIRIKPKTTRTFHMPSKKFENRRDVLNFFSRVENCRNFDEKCNFFETALGTGHGSYSSEWKE